MNRRILTLCCIIVGSIGIAYSGRKVADTMCPKTQILPLVTADRKPTPQLLQLLKTDGIQHDGTLTSIKNSTQEKWIRKPGTERWEIKGKEFNNHAELMQNLSDMGVVREIAPSEKKYDYVVIYGGTFTNMLKRFTYAWTLIQNKVIDCPEIVFLVGQRMANPELEGAESLKHTIDAYRTKLPLKDGYAWDTLPATETELAQLIANQLKLAKSPVTFTFIDTPAQGTPQAPRRPQTGDTIIHWLETKNPTGKALFISNNPHTSYQDAVCQRIFQEMVRKGKTPHVTFETSGPAAEAGEKIELFFDALARWIYEVEKQA
jgi:hypothetical protein